VRARLTLLASTRQRTTIMGCLNCRVAAALLWCALQEVGVECSCGAIMPPVDTPTLYQNRDAGYGLKWVDWCVT
jgi:hypothetical protein